MTHPECWKCSGHALPPPEAGAERLALCDEHLRERIHDLMAPEPTDAPHLEVV
jgi:hypothetical protein